MKKNSITISGLPPSGIAHLQLTRSWLKGNLLKVLKMLKVESARWSIHLINDAAMTEMHRRTMHVSTTTDVLTFDLRDINGQPSANLYQVDLETLVCLDEAMRQARQRRIPLAHEVLLYLIHSLLHVQGYDDQTMRQARQMHRLEDDILLRLGIGPVFYTRGRDLPA